MQTRTSWRGTCLAAVAMTWALACHPEEDGRTLLETLTTPTPLSDLDGDGYTSDMGDCDDSDPSIHPGQPEGPPSSGSPGALDGDGIDNDCDGLIDEGTLDHDDDHDGFTEREGDCNDTDGQIHPERADGCDGIDNDCDSLVDEDVRDAWEPNDQFDTAFDLGDLTCDYAVVEINLDREGDRDLFRFQVCDGASSPSCTSNCLFWVAVQLQAVPDGLDFKLTLYRDLEGTPVPVAAQESWVESAGSILEFHGNPDTDDGGTFYVAVESGTGGAGISCHDEFRLVVFGQKPIEIPLPGETTRTRHTADHGGRPG